MSSLKSVDNHHVYYLFLSNYMSKWTRTTACVLLQSGFKIRRVSRHLLDRYRERNISASQSLGEVADHDVESFIVVPQADKQSTIVMESSQVCECMSG